MARALEVAEAVGATALVARVLSFRAYQAFTDGKIAEGFVHVTSILRKLSVTSRVQAAAVAERARLLHEELT